MASERTRGAFASVTRGDPAANFQSMHARRLSFPNYLGWRLSGELMLAGPGAPLVVFSHGMYSGKDSPRNREVAAALLARGLSAFLFDYTGHGDSEGSLEDSTLERQVGDLGSALDYLQEELAGRLGPLGVSGSSTGGTVALLRAARDDRIRALVVRSVRDYGVSEVAGLVEAPTLVIVGEEDTGVVPEAKHIYAALGGIKNLLVVPGADHLFSGPGQMRQVTEATVSWFARYLTAVPVA